MNNKAQGIVRDSGSSLRINHEKGVTLRLISSVDERR
jgi:hypothetical protein